jgi:hypothetical protein
LLELFPAAAAGYMCPSNRTPIATRRDKQSRTAIDARKKTPARKMPYGYELLIQFVTRQSTRTRWYGIAANSAASSTSSARKTHPRSSARKSEAPAAAASKIRG